MTLASALIYQLIRRTYGWRVVGYWLVIFAGALGAEIVAELAGWEITRFGELRLLPDCLGVVLAVLVLRVLGGKRNVPERDRLRLRQHQIAQSTAGNRKT